ncbi:MAG: urease accessory protein UreD [Gammaproteobacteria bacterium]|jgi:urease accessory protein
MIPVPTAGRWKAHLALELKNFTGKTMIARRDHYGPLVIQKPFYPEGNPCHLYLLHPPGGLVSGDELTLDTKIHKNSHCLITTPGATKFYRSSGQAATQQQTFNIAGDALLEWLPQETIVFDKSHGDIRTHVNLEHHGKYIGWEITCLGRIAGDQPYHAGSLVQKTVVNRCGRPLLIERTALQGDSPVLTAPWGLANHATIGTMVITPGNTELLEAIRESVAANNEELFSATLLGDIVLCRYLGPQAQAAKRVFIDVWQTARPLVQGIEACLPRIWNT